MVNGIKKFVSKLTRMPKIAANCKYARSIALNCLSNQWGCLLKTIDNMQLKITFIITKLNITKLLLLITSSASRHFTINALNKLMCQ